MKRGFGVLSLLAPLPLLAATVTGTVLTPEGSPLPGALVVARSAAAPAVEVLSGERGVFRFSGLPAGEVILEASVPGYLAAIERRTLSADDRIAVVLRIPTAPTEAVTVRADAPRGGIEIPEIRESAARDVGEALASVPGVWALRKGGVANEVVVRGFQSRDLNVLIDGERVYGACPNHMDPPAFHVDFAEVERIEVGKGPFDVLHQGSLGGTVNVVTRRPAPGFAAHANLAVSGDDYRNPSLAASYGGERLAVLGGWSYRAGDAYRTGSGRRTTEITNYRSDAIGERAFEVGTAWAKFAARPADGHDLDLSWTRQQADRVYYPYLMMDAIYDDTDRVRASWRSKRMRAEAYFTRVDHFMTDTWRTSSAIPAATLGWSMGTLAESRTFGGRVEVRVAGWTLGAEGYDRYWNTATRMAGTAYRVQASTPGVTTTVGGLFAERDFDLGDGTTLAAGARLDRARTAADASIAPTALWYAVHGTRSTQATDTLPSATLRLVHRNEDTGFESAIGVGHAARVPEANERYYGLRRPTSDWVGNPLLEPSRNTGVDASVAKRSGRASVGLSVYAILVEEYATVVEKGRARTYADVDATILGGEIDAAVTLATRWFLSGEVSAVRGRQEADPSRGITSRDLAEMPPLRGRLALRWNGPGVWAEGAFEGSLRQDKVDTDLGETPTPSYGVLGVRAGAAWRMLTFTVGVANVFDRDYLQHLSYQRDPFRSGVRLPEPGRTVYANLGMRL
ncbi:MAG TPA: TonB-dependent receptor [Candidatus Polarisedimenticolaceae bacterium]